ncbi:MAG: SH3 domain-containing protein [Burkholderiales bacterium]
MHRFTGTRIRAARARLGLAGAALALLLAACATPAPEPPPAAPPPVVTAPPPVCTACEDQAREIARLQQELGARDAELRELKSTQREQAKSAQETTREVTRAKAKARRLATQADAASYLAEVEVAIAALPPAPSPLRALATAYLQSATEPFARGDYGTAMERASQAEQIVALATGPAPTLQKSARAPGEKLLQVALPLRAVTESRVRRQPQGKAPQVGVIAKDTALTAFAWKDGWMRVETEDGLAGWVDQAALGIR